jgi:hypothetical protein
VLCWVIILSYVWTDGTTNTIVLEDGLYEINTINERLQFAFIANGHYLVDNLEAIVITLILLLIQPDMLLK